jgi:uncharacterized cupin superfamily protein
VRAPNLFEPNLDEETEHEGFRVRGIPIGERAGSERLGASLYEIGPGDTAYPYHWHVANEEMLLVVSGELELREPDGTRTVGAGEVVAFTRGERGAHQFANRGDRPARYLMLSEMNYPEICVYPDADKVGIREVAPAAERDGMRLNFVRGDAVDYWHGERTPEP